MDVGLGHRLKVFIQPPPGDIMRFPFVSGLYGTDAMKLELWPGRSNGKRQSLELRRMDKWLINLPNMPCKEEEGKVSSMLLSKMRE